MSSDTLESMRAYFEANRLLRPGEVDEALNRARSILSMTQPAWHIYSRRELRVRLLHDRFSGGVNESNRAENQHRMSDCKVYHFKDSFGNDCVMCPPHMSKELGRRLVAKGARVDFYGLNLGTFEREPRKRFGRPGMRKKRRAKRGAKR